MRFSNLTDWLAFLETCHFKTIDMDLSRVGLVAKKMGLTTFSCPVITVAGTNGKGSCVALLEAIYRATGYTTGVYTSPHLLQYSERTRLNGTAATDSALCDAFAAIDAMRGTVSLTYFEFGTLAALWLFKQHAFDVIILEVGMGGRLDAVNVVESDIAIITTISLDHTQWLGTDRESIGFEKAGIMRANKPVICGDFAVPHSIVQAAATLSAPLYCQQAEFGYDARENEWIFWNKQEQWEHLPTPSILLQNAATALQALFLLNDKLPVTPAACRKGLQQVRVPGRFQRIELSKGYCILDVAHNPAAGEILAQQIRALPHQGRTFAVIAMLADKDHENTVKPLIPLVDKWWVAKLAVPRGENALPLVEALVKMQAPAIATFPTVSEAYQAALMALTVHDRIIVFGSFYTVAEVIKSAIIPATEATELSLL